MKKLLMVLICLCCVGCLYVGKGSSVGYVTTVEEGIIWDFVWFRADYSSSNTDLWVIEKSQTELKSRLLDSSKNKQRVEILYNKHFALATVVENVVGEIKEFKVVE